MITKFKIFENRNISLLKENYLITEIADTEVEPLILWRSVGIDLSKFVIKVKQRLYMVNINLYGSQEGAMFKIDFMVQLPKDPNKTLWYNTQIAGEYDNMMTNDKDALLVLANILGVIKYWSSLEMKSGLGQTDTNFKDIVIKGLWIRSKSEKLGDKRRVNLYSYFIRKNFQKIGIDVLEEKDVTEKFIKLFKDDYTGPHFTIQYNITPTTIGDLDKKFSRDKIEMYGEE